MKGRVVNYLRDPGEQFDSDTHRRVLAHLSYPDDTYGWTVPALLNRMVGDVGTNFTGPDQITDVLKDLEKDGHAECLKQPSGDVWRMTQDGFDLLTGPIANEPEPGAAVQGPALIGSAGAATSLEPTSIGNRNEADNTSK